jgi:C1A family cysteine protease
MSEDSLIGRSPFFVGEGLEELVLGKTKWFSNLKPLEAKFSWIGHPHLADVSDQRPHDTCVAHSLARANETLRRKKGEVDMRLDPEQFHQCVLGMNCASGVTDIIEAVQKFCKEGAPAKMQAFQAGQSCPAPPVARFGCNDAKKILDPTTAKRAVQEFSPIIALMWCEQRFLNVTSFDIYRDSNGPKNTHHAILIVGFDDTNNCWEVQNSYGKSWGKQGRGRIAYGHASLLADAKHPAFLLY